MVMCREVAASFTVDIAARYEHRAERARVAACRPRVAHGPPINADRGKKCLPATGQNMTRNRARDPYERNPVWIGMAKCGEPLQCQRPGDPQRCLGPSDCIASDGGKHWRHRSTDPFSHAERSEVLARDGR